ncbi:hypothetical protein DVH24_028200 [Malus domestica]|uniref:Uncharacterized protein n=3 Tax=Maleae TaxID=721813 RepID=A0A498HG61_MALDO|nr:hypothetical protein DVH24_028200 [Malus domestica]
MTTFNYASNEECSKTPSFVLFARLFLILYKPLHPLSLFLIPFSVSSLCPLFGFTLSANQILYCCSRKITFAGYLIFYLQQSSFMSEFDTQVPSAFDPFADANAENSGAGTKEYVHVRVQQRNGRKSLTTVQGLKKEYSYNKILKDLKKEFCCNGTVVEDPELGQVIQLQGDQRKNVSSFLVQLKSAAPIFLIFSTPMADLDHSHSSSDDNSVDSREESSQDSKLDFSEDEETLITRMFNLVGERWSLIAGRIPGRSAEEIEKYWTSRYSTSE